MYMVREVYEAQRGRAPEIVAAFKVLDQWFEQAGYTNRRIYVDYDRRDGHGRLPGRGREPRRRTSATERAIFVDPDEETKSLIDRFNNERRSPATGRSSR